MNQEQVNIADPTTEEKQVNFTDQMNGQPEIITAKKKRNKGWEKRPLSFERNEESVRIASVRQKSIKDVISGLNIPTEQEKAAETTQKPIKYKPHVENLAGKPVGSDLTKRAEAVNKTLKSYVIKIYHRLLRNKPVSKQEWKSASELLPYVLPKLANIEQERKSKNITAVKVTVVNTTSNDGKLLKDKPIQMQTSINDKGEVEAKQ